MSKHKTILQLCLIFLPSFAFAQELLWGSTARGGIDDLGVIFSIDPNTGDYTKIFELEHKTKGYEPSNTLCPDGNGILFGASKTGGNFNKGTLFEWNPNLDTYRILHHFDGSDGASPLGKLVYSNGLLLGTTSEGGLNELGTIFQFDLNSETFIKKYDFSISNSSPKLGFTEVNGLFYSSTSLGGNNGSGCIFVWNNTNDSLEILYHNAPLTSPTGEFCFYNGYLYAMSEFGGQYNNGSIFAFEIQNDVFIPLISFNSSNSDGTPTGTLSTYNGKLYGYTKSPLKLFEYEPQVNSLNIIEHFANYATPLGAPLLYNNNFYGTVKYSGYPDAGFIYKFSYQTDTFYSFYFMDSTSLATTPSGGLVLSDSTIYGVSDRYLFDFDYSNNLSIRYLRSFFTADNGEGINSITYFDGKLYGYTNRGARFTKGCFFSYDLQNGIYRNINNFLINEWGHGELIINNNKIYGLYSAPNSTYYGTSTSAYIYDPSTGIYRNGYGVASALSFTGSLTAFKNSIYFVGRPYYMTNYSMLKFSEEMQRTEMYSTFDFKDRLAAVDQKLYGTNEFCISSFNTKNLNTEIEFYFMNHLGHKPVGDLDSHNGVLYGMTELGGDYGYGVIYSFNPKTDNYEVLHHFDSLSGAYPNGDIKYYKGKLFGMTEKGGTHNLGVVFSYDLNAESFEKILDFDGNNGALPGASGFTFIPVADPNFIEDNRVREIHIFPNPADDKIYIYLESHYKGEWILKISDVNGRILRKEKFNKENYILNYQLNVSEFSDGIYYLHLMHSDKKYLEPFVKKTKKNH